MAGQEYRITLKIDTNGLNIFKALEMTAKSFNKALVDTPAQPLKELENVAKSLNENIVGISDKLSKTISFDVFEDIIGTIKDFNRNLDKIPVSPFKEIETTTRNINENLIKISGTLTDSISSQIGNLSGLVETQVVGVAKEAGASLESTYARIGLIISGTIAVGIAKISSETITLTSAFTELSTVFGPLLQFGRSFVLEISRSTFKAVLLLDVFTEAKNKFQAILGISELLPTPVVELLKIFSGLSGILAEVVSNLGIMAGLVSGIVATALVSIPASLIIKTQIKETLQFFTRIIGGSRQIVSPIERASNILLTVDQSIRNIGLNVGNILTNITTGSVFIAGLAVGPVATLVTSFGFINSLISSFFNLFTRGRLQVRGFLGSATARIQLIIFDLKKLALEALPAIRDKAKAFIFLKDQADIADRSLKKLTLGTKEFNNALAVRRAGLPIQQQFSIFAVEMKGFLKEITQQGNQLFLLIGRGMGKTTAELGLIKSEAKLLTKGTVLDIQKSSGFLDNLFQKSRKNINGFFNPIGRIRQIWRNAFSGGQKAINKSVEETKLLTNSQQKILDLESKKLTERKKSSALLGKSADSSKKIEGSTSSLNKTLQATVVSIKDLPNIFERAEKVIKRIPIELNKIELTGLRQQVQDLSKQVLSFGTAGGIGAKGRIFGSVGTPQRIRSLLLQLQQFAIGKIDFSTLTKSLEKFTFILKDLSFHAEGPLGEKLKNLQEIFKKGFKPPKDPKAFQELFQNLENSTKAASKKLGVIGKTTGIQLTNSITKSIRTGKGRAEVEKALIDLTNLMALFFPESPAKRGALKNIPKWGPEINRQLASGIRKGQPTVLKATDKMTTEIAKYFPQSPALLGALVKLPFMGLQIPVQIAKGMLNGIGVVKDAANKIGQVIFDATKRIAETQFFSERFGIKPEVISSFNFALASVGANTSDLSFAFQSFQRILSKTLNDEDRKKFTEIGLDIDKAKRSSQPFINLLNQVSTELTKAGAGTEKFGKIVESVGLTLQSRFVNFLLKGPEALKDLRIESAEAGTVIDKELGKLGTEFVGIIAKFEAVKNSFLNSALKEILPTAIKIGNEILQIFKDNQTTISAVLATIARFFTKVLAIGFKFTKFLLVEPQAAFIVVLDVFNAFLKLFLKSGEIGLNAFLKLFKRFFVKLGPVALLGLLALVIKLAEFGLFLQVEVIRLLGDTILNVAKNIKDKIKNVITETLGDVAITISEQVKKIPGISKLLGNFILSPNDIIKIRKSQADARKKIKGTGKILKDAFDAFNETAKKEAKKEIPNLLDNLITKEDKKEFKATLQEVTDDLSKTIKTIQDRVITVEDVNKRLQKIGQTFKAGIEKALGFIFSDKTQGKILKGLGFAKDQFIKTSSDIINSETVQSLKNIFVSNFKDQKKKIQALKDAQIKAINEAGNEVKKVTNKVKKVVEKTAKIPLLSQRLINEAKKLIDNFKDKYKTLNELISKTTEVAPFEGLKIGLEALRNAASEDIPFIKKVIEDAFGKVKEIDPFKTLRQSLRLLKEEAGGAKEAIGATQFGEAIGTEQFKQKAEEKPSGALQILGTGFLETSGENLGKLKDQFLGTFEEIAKKHPFKTLAFAMKNYEKIAGKSAKAAETVLITAMESAANYTKLKLTQLNDIVSAVFELTGKKSRALFIAQKAIAIAQATINIAVGVTKAIFEGGIAGIITGVAVAAAGAVQIAKITAQKPPDTTEFQEGGLLEGPSHDNGGIPIINRRGLAVAEAEGGEYFINKQATRFYGPKILEEINSQEIPRRDLMNLSPDLPAFGLQRFQNGGGFGIPENISIGERDEKQTVVQITNIPDTTAAIDRYFAEGRGEKQVLNVVGNNGAQVRERIGIG